MPFPSVLQVWNHWKTFALTGDLCLKNKCWLQDLRNFNNIVLLSLQRIFNNTDMHKSSKAQKKPRPQIWPRNSLFSLDILNASRAMFLTSLWGTKSQKIDLQENIYIFSWSLSWQPRLYLRQWHKLSQPLLAAEASFACHHPIF